MKAKTLMGMIACASACVSISAFGNTTNDWFSVGVANNAIDPVNCSTNGVAVSIENSKIVLDNEYTTRLAITPAVGLASTNSTDVAKIDVTALLTPSSTNDLAVIDDAKAGFTVGIDDQNQTNYYGFANGKWNKLTGGNPEKDGDTTFSIIINYRDKNVKFIADSVDLTPTPLAIDANSSFSGIDAFGSGSITSVNSKFEVAVAAYAGNKYGSIAEAVTAAGESASGVQGISPSGVVQNIGAKAANGMDYVVCEALGLDVTDPNADIAVAPVATDTAADKITLHLTTSTTGTEADLVGYAVTGSATVYNADSIQIPLAAGTYTITPVLK